MYRKNTHIDNLSFGPDAGAASAGLLAVMPRSRSMVARVVSISGSPLADWAAFGDKFRAMNTSMVFGERVRKLDNILSYRMNWLTRVLFYTRLAAPLIPPGSW